MHYRPIKNTEHQFLEEMLFQALFIPKGQAKPPKSIVKEPTLSKYLEKWSQKEGDIAIVATKDGKLIGAIWGRKFKANNQGYGFVDEETPEIAMAVKESYRNKGIGTELLRQIESSYSAIGTNQISLSVDKRNMAKMMYQRNGYEIYAAIGTAITMVKTLKNA